MSYLPVANEVRAIEISQALFDLRRPNPDPRDGTFEWIGWIVHADGRAALQTSGAGQARIDPDCVPDSFIDLIKQGFTQQEIQDAKDVINAAKGSRVSLAQIVPQRIKDKIKTDAEMEADGWFD